MVRILIVGDVRLYREGLVLHLSGVPEMCVVAVAADAADALAATSTHLPDVVLVDLAMPEALATIRAIGDAAGHVRVVALAVPETEHAVISCAEAGVAGYITRDASLDDLVAAVSSAARGELIVSPRMAASLLRRVSALAAGQEPPRDAALTQREREIARHIDEGLSNKQIAARLGIEVATVKNHVHNILEKLQLHHRRDVSATIAHARRAVPAYRAPESGGREVRR
jgi:two-component system, NarL family, nitrate/nitrite response regulator NarL